MEQDKGRFTSDGVTDARSTIHRPGGLMTTLRIALLQMASHGGDQAANQAKGEAFCRRARELGADVALFPEMWNIGYGGYEATQAGAREAWQALAIGEDGP